MPDGELGKQGINGLYLNATCVSQGRRAAAPMYALPSDACMDEA